MNPRIRDMTHTRDMTLIANTQVSSIITSFPYILAYSVDKKIAPAVEYFVHELGISRGALAKILLRKPQLLGYSIPNKLRPTVAFFMHELEVTRLQVALMLVRCPALLGYSITDNLLPTLEFLRSTASLYNATVRDWIPQVLAAPQLLTYSLEQRIKPRIREALQSLRKRPSSAAAVAHAIKTSNESFQKSYSTGAKM
jgi:mTERF domain-containing protein